MYIYLFKLRINKCTHLCYNIYSEREKGTFTAEDLKGSEALKLNATELIADLINKIEELVRENERLKAEIELLKNKQ